MIAAAARQIDELGLGSEDIIAVHAERSLELVVGIMAVGWAGCAYLPLSPYDPPERTSRILELSDAKLVVSGGRTALAFDAPRILELDLSRRDAASSPCDPGRECAAYVLYTSGSTGEPKGVVVEHSQLAAHTHWFNEEFSLRPDDRVLQRTPVTFDASVWEIFSTLTSGATMVLAPAGAQVDIAALARSLTERRITRLQCVPSLLEALVEFEGFGTATSLQTVFCGGEPLKIELARRLWSQRPVELVNLYGPTETTVDATFARLQPGASRVSIGNTVPYGWSYVVDDDGNPALEGELWIGGQGVARAYLNRPDLTEAAFIPDPNVPGGRVFKTGDRVRINSDGSLDYLGRRDNQVKLRGQRIELGEIEAAASGLPGVGNAAAVVRQASGGPRLECIVEPSGGAELDGPALRAELARLLPPAMVPTSVIVMPRLPLTAHGKLDRVALSSAPVAARVRPGDVEDGSSLEAAVLEAWREMFGLAEIGLDDDFYSIGGHSLLAARLCIVLNRRFKAHLAPHLFDEHRTPRALAALLKAAEGERFPSLFPVDRSIPQPLSFAQERMWLTHALDPGASRNNVGIVLHIDGALNEPALEAALNRLVERHESLRTRYFEAGGEPLQCIEPARSSGVPLVRATVPKGSQSIAPALEKLAAQPFDLGTPPLIRAFLGSGERGSRWLLIVQPHIATDAWSAGILNRDLSAFYSEAVTGDPERLPALELQYVDWAGARREALTSERARELEEHWRRFLEGVPLSIDPPPRPGAQPSAQFSRSEWLLDPIELQALRSRAAGRGVSLNSLFAAALQSLIANKLNLTDFLIGVPVADRRQPEMAEVSGLFINTLPLRCSVDEGAEPEDLLTLTHGRLLEISRLQDYPFEHLVRLLRPPRQRGRMPLVQALLNVVENLPSGDWHGLQVEAHSLQMTQGSFDLLIDMQLRGAGVTGIVELSAAWAASFGSAAEVAADYRATLLAFLEPGFGEAQTRPASPSLQRTAVTARPRGGSPVHFLVEVATTAREWNRGLMFRGELDENEGLLIALSEPLDFKVWMKNTPVSLDLLFIGEDGRIVRIIERAEPCSEYFHSAGQKVKAVLEIPGGSVDRIGLEPGDEIEIGAEAS